MEKNSRTFGSKLLIFMLSLVGIVVLAVLTGDYTITMPAVYPLGCVVLGCWIFCEIAEKVWPRRKNE